MLLLNCITHQCRQRKVTRGRHRRLIGSAALVAAVGWGVTVPLLWGFSVSAGRAEDTHSLGGSWRTDGHWPLTGTSCRGKDRSVNQPYTCNVLTIADQCLFSLWSMQRAFKLRSENPVECPYNSNWSKFVVNLRQQNMQYMNPKDQPEKQPSPAWACENDQHAFGPGGSGASFHATLRLHTWLRQFTEIAAMSAQASLILTVKYSAGKPSHKSYGTNQVMHQNTQTLSPYTLTFLWSSRQAFQPKDGIIICLLPTFLDRVRRKTDKRWHIRERRLRSWSDRQYWLVSV